MGSIELPVSKMAEWEAINVPLSCLKKDGLNESKVQIRGLFSSEEQINFDVNSIIIKDGAITGTKVSC
jgi:hypothetical protein